MYLTDRQIRARLDTLGFDVPRGFEPFDPEVQIQPCSIDLRLGIKVWTERPQRRELDLRRSKLLEVNPRRHWKERSLGADEYVRLRPGQLILAHTLEFFTMPPDCAGKIEGRSSFARLGLAIHCTGDFINPGYKGHMSLQMTNHSRTTLRLYPGMPVCQLVLVGLRTAPEREYGGPGLQSKYSNDDGGPSYWWRDRLVRRLLERLEARDYSLGIQAQLVKLVGEVEVDVLDRFEEFVAKRRAIEVDSADSVLDGFAASEDKARTWDTLKRRVPVGAFVVLLGATLSILFVHPVTLGHWIVWILTLISSIGGMWSMTRHDASWLTTGRLVRLRAQARSADERV